MKTSKISRLVAALTADLYFFFFFQGRLHVWPTRMVVMTRERLARESVMLMPFRFGTSVMLRPPDALHFPTCGRWKQFSWVCHVCKWVMTSADSPRANHLLLHDRLNRIWQPSMTGFEKKEGVVKNPFGRSKALWEIQSIAFLSVMDLKGK